MKAKYYKQHFAQHLLSEKTVSYDVERSLIMKLKTKSGYQFTSKLEGMFIDIKTYMDTMQGLNTLLVGFSEGLLVLKCSTYSYDNEDHAICPCMFWILYLI